MNLDRWVETQSRKEAVLKRKCRQEENPQLQ
jgi:hypothetical protein